MACFGRVSARPSLERSPSCRAELCRRRSAVYWVSLEPLKYVPPFWDLMELPLGSYRESRKIQDVVSKGVCRFSFNIKFLNH